MLRNPFILVSLTTILSLVVLHCLVAAVRAPSPAARVNQLLTAVLGLGLLLVPAGWNTAATVPLLVVLTAAVVWFAVQAALHRRSRFWAAGWSVGGCLYRAVGVVIGMWILTSSRSAAAGQQQNHQLGSILGALIGAVVMTLMCAGWLLATFAAPKEDTSAKPVQRLKGLHEALLAAGLALTLFALA